MGIPHVIIFLGGGDFSGDTEISNIDFDQTVIRPLRYLFKALWPLSLRKLTRD